MTVLLTPPVRDEIMRALSVGAVPRFGLEFIRVGRVRELEAALKGLDAVEQGHGIVYFISIAYGGGKTFHERLVASLAQRKGFVVSKVDLTPERRLHGSEGQGLALYREMVQGLSAGPKTEGGALREILDGFVSAVRTEMGSGEEGLVAAARQRLAGLTELVEGFAFVDVVLAYVRGAETQDQELMSSALRWLSGEYATKREVPKALGVRSIISDRNFYCHIKLLARLTALSGFLGLVIFFDEMANISRIVNGPAHRANLEKVLQIVNDTYQGNNRYLGFFFAGTPDFIEDSRKGLYSYPALRTRLAENAFARDGLVDFASPVLKLPSLEPEDLFVLLKNIRFVHAGGDESKFALPDEGLLAFMSHCRDRIGDAYFRTPRDTTVSFVRFLAVLDQNPNADWRSLLGAVQVGESDVSLNGGSTRELASFSLTRSPC